MKPLDKRACSLGLSILLLVLFPTQALAERQRVEWGQVPKADHYNGYYEEAGIQKRFRTASLWVLMDLEAGAKLRVIAVDEYGFYVGLVSIDPKPLSAGPEDNKQDTPHQDVDFKKTQEGSSTQGDSSELEAKSGEKTYDDALLFLDVDDPYAAPEVKRQAAKSLEPYVRGERPMALLKLGLGREKLGAVGGIAEYTGSSSIGSTSLALFGMSEEGWAFGVKSEFHSFDIVAKTEADDETFHTDSFLRTNLDLRVGLELLGRPHIALIPSLNYIYSTVPMLSQIEMDSGKARFKLQALGSPGLGLELYGTPSKSHRLGGSLVVFPIASTSALMGYQIDLDYSYFVNSNWFFNAAALRSQSRAEIKRTCPAVDECRETIKSTLATGQLAVGGGYAW